MEKAEKEQQGMEEEKEEEEEEGGGRGERQAVEQAKARRHPGRAPEA